jgi:hypothetical protein
MNKCFFRHITKSTFRKLHSAQQGTARTELDRGSVSANHGISLSTFRMLCSAQYITMLSRA